MVWYLSQYLSKEQITQVSQLVSNLLLLSIIVAFLIGGLRRKINVYEAFIEGAKGGIQTSLTIIPYLVGMLVAISVLRHSACWNSSSGASPGSLRRWASTPTSHRHYRQR
jgi:spore maturation protein SpmB